MVGIPAEESVVMLKAFAQRPAMERPARGTLIPRGQVPLSDGERGITVGLQNLGQRASFGALQSRFETTVNNLQSTSENMSASRGRIQDADFAAETANLSRSQILQQAGTAMVAQANQLPQGVLALLR